MRETVFVGEPKKTFCEALSEFVLVADFVEQGDGGPFSPSFSPSFSPTLNAVDGKYSKRRERKQTVRSE